MLDRFALLWSTGDFPARWYCGNWSSVLGWLHIVSDLVTWAAYTAIPLTLAFFITRRRDIVFPRVFWLFAVFIFSCGTVHLVEAGIFWWPVYRLSALIKVTTAVVSTITVFALIRATPAALALPGLATINHRLESEIRERERVTGAIRQSEERYRSLVAATSSIVWTTDPEGRFVEDQPSWTAYTGQPFAECRDLGWAEMFHPEDRAELTAAWREALHRYRRFEARGRLWSDAHQAYRHFVVQAVAVRVGPDDDRTREWVGTVSDVDDQHRAEGALRRSDERMHLAVEASPTGMLLVNASGKIVMANSRSAEMFGYEGSSALVGSGIDGLVPVGARDGHQRLRADYMIAPSARPMGPGRELHARRRDGTEFPVEIGLTPLDTDEGPLVLASVLDITERKRAEDALQRANQELQQKNREIEQFVYAVSHDLKAPLVTCEGFLGILRKRLDQDDRSGVDECVTRVHRATRRMGEMIDDILRLSRLGKLTQELEPVSLGPLIQQVVADLPAAFEEHRVQVDVGDDLPVVRGNRNALQEVLENLLTNAFKYGRSSSGGSVRIGAKDFPGEHRVFIEDDGPGIPLESREAIFQMYHRLEDDTEGTGMGLAIVLRIMQLHGGRAWVDDGRSGGARFWLSFRAGGA
jgi:PAS domain S-box-containing protein